MVNAAGARALAFRRLKVCIPPRNPEADVQIKLETQRGEAVHTADTAFDNDPPDVVFWNGRTFRLLRTDGVWDHKKHVYREASVHDLGHSPQNGAANGAEHGALNGVEAPIAEAPVKDKKKSDRQ